MKFLVINMPDFDPDSVKPGTGQVIFIEGENADFKPLQPNTTPFPAESYLNRVADHLFNIGIPKIALAAGTAPYTGKVAAVQYQPVVALVTDLRIQWEVVLEDLIDTIQQYLIDYFPESHDFMREHLADGTEGELRTYPVEFDWDNVLPLSRSDKIVDASTLRDRHAISLGTYLEQAGFADPQAEIKKLKKESQDAELITIIQQFLSLSKGVTEATLEQQKAMRQAEEDQAATTGAIDAVANPPTQPAMAPMLNQSQNDGRRGVPSGPGTPTGQTATPEGAVRQTTQNINAKAGV